MRWEPTGKRSDRKRVLCASGGDHPNFAKATADPNISAALIGKAADLTLQVDENGEPDLTPLAWDVEPPRAIRLGVRSQFCRTI
jgi:hypothetical protein